MIWQKLIDTTNDISRILDVYCEEYHEPDMERFNNSTYGWTNRTWRNQSLRRAHLEIVDARETKKLWIVHFCIFPDIKNNGPIYGFDIIAGQKKITGAFHDISALMRGQHPLTDWFIQNNKWFKPNKQRELPEWARAIFSDGMIAAGNIEKIQELDQICDMAKNNLEYYLKEIIKYNNLGNVEDNRRGQNFYSENQHKNPHVERSMLSLGLPENDVKVFLARNLFPIV